MRQRRCIPSLRLSVPVVVVFLAFALPAGEAPAPPDVPESVDCDADGVPDVYQGAPVFFVPGAESVDVSSTPRGLAVADLDLDRIPDVVVATKRSGVFVLRGRGERVFFPAHFDAPEGLRDIAVADLDADGDSDVIIGTESTLHVLENVAGNLLAGDASVLAGSPAALRTGDVTGNGRPDVVALLTESSEIAVFPASEDGRLEAPIKFVVDGDAVDLAVADVDGDGDQDVVCALRQPAVVLVFENRGGGELVPLDKALDLGGRRPVRLEASDLNGDALLDLIVLGSGRLSVFVGRPEGGFDTARSFSASGRFLAAGDFDDDGDTDLVTEGVRELALRVNDGAAGFAVTTTVLSGSSFSQLVPGDLDGDGRPDIVGVPVSTSTVNLLWNEGVRRFSFERHDVPIRRPHGAAVGDFDGDGSVDALVSNTHLGSFTFLRNDGLGNLLFESEITFGGQHPMTIDVGDLDGDGDVDAVTADNLDDRFYVHRGRGDGSFEKPVTYPADTAAFEARLRDLDGDGHLDGVTTNEGGNTISLFFNRGDGTFLPAEHYPTRAGPKSTASADLDGDGDVDIVVGHSHSNFVSVFPGGGGRTLEERVDYRVRGHPYAVDVGDLNEDGFLDVATGEVNTFAASFLYNRGDGTFAEPVPRSLGVSPFSIALVDLDGDSHLDLLTGNESQGSVTIVAGHGDGTFDTPLHFAAAVGTRFVLSADFDRDGDLDVAVPNRRGFNLSVFYQDSRLEVEDFRYEVCTPQRFYDLSREISSARGPQRFVKFVAPARDDPSLLPVVFQNSGRFALHQEFLLEVFSDRFPALTSDEYARRVGRRATREYFAGAITRISPREAGRLTYGFDVFVDPLDTAELLSQAEIGALYSRLSGAFLLERLAYAPSSRLAREAAASWTSVDFPVYLRDAGLSTAYEAYTRGVGFGRVRIVRANEIEQATTGGAFGFQDILVLELAPRDLEGIAAGVITQEPQGALSHVAIRTARRGTPNAFAAGALELFLPWEGRLVRLEVTDTGATVEEASTASAEEFWSRSRPELSAFPMADRDYRELPDLLQVAAQEIGATPLESRFGGKTSHLARLQALLTEPEYTQYRLDGFVVPAAYYLDFLESNRIPSSDDPGRSLTYAESIDALLSEPRFQTDSAYRFEKLEALRDHMRGEGQVDDDLVRRIAARIGEVFGASDERVRFRSSSNVEDALEFNGAGLYDSTSVCAADDLDGDGKGPSLCDSERAGERGVARGLKKVWASLWSYRAHEERAFYGIEQRDSAMAVLVTKAFTDEIANGVAFSGNPQNAADHRYVVTVQAGEASVVSPTPGVLPEKDLLEIGPDGRVNLILRDVPSSLLRAGAYVLSESKLRELGALLSWIDRRFPVDVGQHGRHEVLLDIEFKVRPDNSLAVKQIRPFLLPEPGPPPPTFTLVVPGGVTACGVFRPGRGPALEHRLKSTVRFRPGAVEMPAALETFSANLVGDLRFGSAATVAEPLSDGVFRVRQFSGRVGEVTYSFDYEQEFAVSSAGAEAQHLQFRCGPFEFVVRDGLALRTEATLDDRLLRAGESSASATVLGPEPLDVQYGSCFHDELSLWEVVFDGADGSRFELEERFLADLLDTGPASLVRAQLRVAEIESVVTDYWNLVYSASRHNERVVYWIVLDQALRTPSVVGEVHAIELVAPEPREGAEGQIRYLGPDFEVLGTIVLRAYTRRAAPEPLASRFLRGDVNADGGVALDDATTALDFIFRKGTPPPCHKAADVNDDGRINLLDPLALLAHLFRRGADIPQPFPECGEDTSDDPLSCIREAACR
jgi:hypothetical protein